MLLALETRLWSSTASLDEEDSSSYSGFFQSTVRGIAALALATTLFSSALSGQVAQQDQSDLAPGIASAPDESYWQNQTQPVPPSLYQALPYFFDAGEIVPAPATFQPDDDFWRSGVAPVWWTNLYPRQSSFDSQDPVLFGQYDEEFWRNSVRPVPATQYQNLPYLFESADFVLAILPTFNEDFWQSGVAPVPPSLYQQFPYLFDPGELNSQAQNGTALPAGQALVIASNNPTASTGAQAPGGSLPARRRGGVSSGPPPIIFGIARPAGLSLRADQGKVSASGSARATVAVPALRIGAGQPTAKGIKNPTAEELMAILIGL